MICSCCHLIPLLCLEDLASQGHKTPGTGTLGQGLVCSAPLFNAFPGVILKTPYC